MWLQIQIILLLLLAPWNCAEVVPNTGNYTQKQLQTLANAWRLSPAQAATLNRSQDAGKLRICITAYSPQVYCDAAQPQETYTGYQVEVFREIAKRVSWLTNPDSWFFDCIPWTPLITDLLSNNGTCLMAPAGIAATQERLAQGMQISWLLDKEGYRIMIAPSNRELNLWTPFTVFSGPLWLLLLCTSVVVGLVLWVVDTQAYSLLPSPAKLKKRRVRRLRAALDDLLFHSNLSFRQYRRRGRRGIVQHAQLASMVSDSAVSIRDTSSSSFSSNCSYRASKWNSDMPSVVAAGPAAASASQSMQQQQLQYLSEDAAKQPLSGSEEEPVLEPHVAQPTKTPSLLRWLGVRQGEEQEAIDSLQSHMSSSFLRMPDMGDPPAVQTLPAKIVLFAYGLLILIIVALYTASAAAQLTAQSLKSDIRSINDLKGKAVVTWDGYADKLQEQGLPTIKMPWETIKDEEAMLNMVLSGQAKALILGATFVDAVTHERCEFAAAGDTWNMMDSGIGYNKRMPSPLQESVNREIQAAIEERSIERIYNIYIRKQGSGCASATEEADTVTKVGLEQVAGLWVMLALSLAVAVLILAMYRVQRRCRRHVRRLAMHASRHMQKMSQSISHLGSQKSSSPGGSSRDHTFVTTSTPETAQAAHNIIRATDRRSTEAAAMNDAATTGTKQAEMC